MSDSEREGPSASPSRASRAKSTKSRASRMSHGAHTTQSNHGGQRHDSGPGSHAKGRGHSSPGGHGSPGSHRSKSGHASVGGGHATSSHAVAGGHKEPESHGGHAEVPEEHDKAGEHDHHQHHGEEHHPDWVKKLVRMEEVLGNVEETIRMLEGEFWGTLLLVFLGVSSCMDWSSLGAPSINLVSISLSFGLAVATIAQMLGHVSGAHLNPAVSFGLVAAGDCGLAKACCYFIIQTFGSFMGSMIAMAILHPAFLGGTPTSKGITGSLSKLNGISGWQGILNECFITFPLIFTVCAVCDKGNDFKGSAPLAIGLSITLGHLVGIPATGASMNPARTIGPLMAASMYKRKVSPEAQKAIAKASGDLWVYIIGPILGGILAGLLYRFRYSSKNLAGGKKKED